MKSRRFLSALLCLTLLLTLLAPAALANSWGLKSGMILNAVPMITMNTPPWRN